MIGPLPRGLHGALGREIDTMLTGSSGANYRPGAWPGAGLGGFEEANGPSAELPPHLASYAEELGEFAGAGLLGYDKATWAVDADGGGLLDEGARGEQESLGAGGVACAVQTQREISSLQ